MKVGVEACPLTYEPTDYYVPPGRHEALPEVEFEESPPIEGPTDDCEILDNQSGAETPEQALVATEDCKVVDFGTIPSEAGNYAYSQSFAAWVDYECLYFDRTRSVAEPDNGYPSIFDANDYNPLESVEIQSETVKEAGSSMLESVDGYEMAEIQPEAEKAAYSWSFE